MNVLLYAFMDATDDHPRYRAWLQAAASGDEPLGIADVVLSGVVRLATHPRVFARPAPLDAALAFAAALQAAPAAVPVRGDDRQWPIFERLCRSANARGNLVADAWIASLVVASGAELITTDRDFSRFAGLRWRPPFQERRGTPG
jgi:toxin-antitoxin system PIN domain toxin